MILGSMPNSTPVIEAHSAAADAACDPHFAIFKAVGPADAFDISFHRPGAAGENNPQVDPAYQRTSDNIHLQQRGENENKEWREQN